MNGLALLGALVCSPALRAQAPARPPADSMSPALILEGKMVFEGQVGGALCFSCHGMNAKGVGPAGPDLTDGTWLHGDGGLAFLRDIITAGVPKPTQSVAPMPPMGGATLTEAQVRALAAYIHSLQPRKT